MKGILRTYLALILAGLLVLSGQGMAMAHTTDPSGQIVVCSGSGPTVVYVDEDGQPVGPPMYCPECALHILDAAEVPQGVAIVQVARPQVLTLVVPVRRVQRAVLRVFARGPPDLV